MHYEEYTSLEVKGQQGLFLLLHSLLITRTSAIRLGWSAPSEDVLHHFLSLASTNVTLAFQFQLSSRQQTTFSPFMQRLTEKLVKAIFDWFPRSYLLSHLQSNRPSVHGWQHSCSSRWSEGTLPPPPSSSCGPSQIPPSPYPTCMGEEGRRREEKKNRGGGRKGKEEKGRKGDKRGKRGL